MSKITWKVTGRVLSIAFGCMKTFTLCHAATSETDLPDLSLEELSNIPVTSVSKRAEPLANAPASIFVITGEDIRRSGATTLPEALRLAPNLQVAQVDARNYAITARGFNSPFENKILVLIDGRIVYSPLFSGVFWDAQDVVLEDVARIEVVSGADGTLWGANVVNGVINIITKSSADTQGGLISASDGKPQTIGEGRYGGTLDNGGHYRFYAKHIETSDTEPNPQVVRRQLLAGPGTKPAFERTGAIRLGSSPSRVTRTKARYSSKERKTSALRERTWLAI